MIWSDYEKFYAIRRTEETLLDLYSRGLLFGTVHTCIGQEPVPIGVIDTLNLEKDVIWSNHRGHGHYLAYSDDIEGLIAEVMGRATGVCGGVGGSQHLHKRNFYTNGVLGGTVACAVGSALAEKVRGEGAIAVVFLGDGALGEGIVYESFNLASLWALPILFVLEHNGIAQTTPTDYAHAGDLILRAASFGIETSSGVATEIEAVRALAKSAVADVRTKSRPHFLRLHTLRLGPHSKGDDSRTETDVFALREQDPILSMARKLDDLDPGRKRDLEALVEKRISAAVKASKASPFLEDFPRD